MDNNSRRLAITFGGHVKNEREKQGKQQKKFAEETNIPSSSLCLYESGKVVPPLDKCCAIADALNVSVDYLAGRKDTSVKPVSNLADIAESIIKLCDFTAVSLEVSDDKVSLQINDSTLNEFFRHQLNLKQALRYSSASKEECQKLLKDNLKMSLASLESINVERKTEDETGKFNRDAWLAAGAAIITPANQLQNTNNQSAAQSVASENENEIVAEK